MARTSPTRRLELACAPLPGLRLLYVVMVLCALGCLALLPLPLWQLLLLQGMIVLLGWHCWRQRGELGGPGTSVIWDAEGQWWWLQSGEETPLVLAADSYLSTAMVILNFIEPGFRRRRSLLLFPASVGRDRFRRLRVRLLLEGGLSVRSGRENSPG